MQATSTLEQHGYVGPVPLLSRAECREVAAHLRRSDFVGTSTWEKGRAVDERLVYDIATRAEILARVTAALGPDVVLWGATFVVRAPGERHPWHSDIESCGVDGGFLSVWIGIENTTRDSALQFVAGSHRLGRPLQQVRAERGLGRDETAPEVVLSLARERDESAALVEPEMGDGDAIFFDGRLWHGTDNRQRSRTRTALLLQYAAADRAVRMPDWDELDWPFRFREEPRPPVLVVSGSAPDGVNDVVPPPAGWSGPIRAAARTFDPLPEVAPSEAWRPFPAFHGTTKVVAELSCHASALAGGHSPHPPHAHAEEEILIALRGEVELVIPGDESDPSPRTERLRPGSFVFYPAWQLHTIRNPGDSTVAYLMLKWRAPSRVCDGALGTEVVRVDRVRPGAEGFATRRLLDGPTASLTTLHSHETVLGPGAGYEAHVDEHDVVIVLLQGEIDTLGRRIRAPGVVCCPAGEPHGMHNPGQSAARYLVVELHGDARTPVTSARSRVAALVRRARARRP